MTSPITPPPLPLKQANLQPSILVVVLSLLLALFVATGVITFLSDSLLMLFNQTVLAAPSALGSLLMLLLGIFLYGMMAISPRIPKLIFLPISLYLPVSWILTLPALVFFHSHAAWIAWTLSLGQVLLGLGIIYKLTGTIKIQWPLISESRLLEKSFSWKNFAATCALATFIIIPSLMLYTAFSAKLAIEHFTDHFVALRASGLSMQVRHYVRDDGKKIMLVPMSHVGEPEFYHALSNMIPEDSTVLMEGVSDMKHLLNTHSNYSKMANAVGGVEQTQVFKPKGKLIPADLDISNFSPETLDLLKTTMLIHSKGITPETLPILMKPAPPGIEKKLMHDILNKRNQHLLEVIKNQLPDSEHLIVPWGAAHMPEVSQGILKMGFRVVDTKEFLAIRFGS